MGAAGRETSQVSRQTASSEQAGWHQPSYLLCRRPCPSARAHTFWMASAESSSPSTCSMTPSAGDGVARPCGGARRPVRC
jgi:hypothetical protein